MSSGKFSGQVRSEIDSTGAGSAAAISSSAADVARMTDAHLRDQRSRAGDVETLALVVNRCRRHAGFNQLDAPTVHDLVVGRRGHGYGPAEMIGDSQTHVTKT